MVIPPHQLGEQQEKVCFFFKGSRLLQNHFVEQTESTGDILVLNDNRRKSGAGFLPKMSSAKISIRSGERLHAL